MTHPTSRTSVTLLGRLCQEQTDQAAWSEFVHRYGPSLYGWCRGWRLPEADAEEVAQEVLVKLADKLRTFAYDPTRSFRAWLKTLTHHAWHDFLESRRRVQGTGDPGVLACLESAEAREDLIERLEGTYDLELLEEAQARVRLRVTPQTWEAFRLTALEDLSGAEAGRRLKQPVATIFVNRSRVQKLIKQEIERLNTPNRGANDVASRETQHDALSE